MIKIGDRLVVQGSEFPAYIERIYNDPETKRVIIELDWREFGKSQVYLHDENKIWYQFININ